MFLPAKAYMRISHPDNAALCSEDLLAMLSVCDSNVCSNVRQLALAGVTSLIRSCEAERSISALRHIRGHMCHP